MKKAFAIFFLFLFYFSAQGQNISLIDTNKKWSVMNGGWGSFTTNNVKFSGDTVINTIQYKKCWLFDSTWGYWMYFKSIRKDTLGKIYARVGNGDSLIYDFNLSIGDTVTSTGFEITMYFTSVMVVDSIDTVFIGNNFRKRWFFQLLSGCGYIDVWIEGIGSLNGVLIPGSLPCDAESYLLCYFENDTLQYINPIYNTCYINTTGVEENNLKENISLSPNPVTNSLQLSVSNWQGEKTAIEIFDVVGKSVFKSLILNPKSQIDVSSFPLGVYYLKISSHEKSAVKKFVKM